MKGPRHRDFPPFPPVEAWTLIPARIRYSLEIALMEIAMVDKPAQPAGIRQAGTARRQMRPDRFLHRPSGRMQPVRSNDRTGAWRAP